MKEYDEKVYDRKGADGKIRIEPRGFYTNNPKRGYGNSTVGHCFNNIKYQE